MWRRCSSAGTLIQRKQTRKAEDERLLGTWHHGAECRRRARGCTRGQLHMGRAAWSSGSPPKQLTGQDAHSNVETFLICHNRDLAMNGLNHKRRLNGRKKTYQPTKREEIKRDKCTGNRKVRRRMTTDNSHGKCRPVERETSELVLSSTNTKGAVAGCLPGMHEALVQALPRGGV